MLIRISLFPKGKNFAVSFVDDTDFSTKANTKPVYDLLYEKRLRATKTVWVFRNQRSSSFRPEIEKTAPSIISGGSTLQDPEYLDFVENLKSKGFEIALHGVSAGNNLRDETIRGIDAFRNIFGEYPKINVFHQTNIENLYAGSAKLDIFILKLLERIVHNSDYQGHKCASPYFWGDYARETIKYMRLPFHSVKNVNTLRVNPDMPFHDRKRPYVNYWFLGSDGSNCMTFCKLLRKENVDKLQKERGICVVYTHFAKGFTHRAEGTYSLDPNFSAVVNDLAERQDGWYPTTSELLDRILSLKMLALIKKDHTFYLHNTGNTDIYSLQLMGERSFMAKDENLNVYNSSADGILKIPRIMANSSLLLATPKRTALKVRGAGRIEISQLSRMKIELSNYIGLIRERLPIDY
ncbi:MAG: hypothetical protein A2Z74_06605 [Chloroflexi bacterium RBG_13_46_9]|nr:MAG: hypothetical protein A2Z74_06605 [Chloroflexi bacterium RBG_13_46_9]